MKLICYLAAWVIPSAVWLFRERVEVKRREYNESVGRVLKNPIHWARVRQAKRIGAAAYIITLFALQFMTWRKVVFADAIFIGAILFPVMALVAYNLAFLAVRGFQEVMARANGAFNPAPSKPVPFTDSESLDIRDRAYLNLPVGPPDPGALHGGARVVSPGQQGLVAESDVTGPKPRMVSK